MLSRPTTTAAPITLPSGARAVLAPFSRLWAEAEAVEAALADPGAADLPVRARPLHRRSDRPVGRRGGRTSRPAIDRRPRYYGT